MALTPLHVTQVCNASSSGWSGPRGKTCKYLTHFSKKDGTWVNVCSKKAPLKRPKYPAVPAGQPNPYGDNCPGYLYLKYAKQGFDVPGSV